MRSYPVICALAVLSLSACSKPSDVPADSDGASVVAPETAPVQTKLSGKAPDAASTNTIDCLTPVHVGDTYKSLAVAYGNNAQLGMVPGAEGTESKGLLLYATVPSRKLYVTFWDAAMHHVSRIEPAERAVAWKVSRSARRSTISRRSTASPSPSAVLAGTTAAMRPISRAAGWTGCPVAVRSRCASTATACPKASVATASWWTRTIHA